MAFLPPANAAFLTTAESGVLQIDARRVVGSPTLLQSASPLFSIDARPSARNAPQLTLLETIVFPIDARHSPRNVAPIFTRQTDLFILDTRPFIENRPFGLNIAAEGSSWMISAPATGAFSYQWFRNGSPIPGQTGEDLIIPAVSPENAGDYFVVIDGPEGRRASETLQLAVLAAPRIQQNPASQILRAGAPNRLVLQATASGSAPLAYQWLRDNIEIPNATAAQLLIDPPAVSHSGSYTLRVTNPVGAATSQPATITIVDTLSIATQPVSQTAALGQRVTLSVSLAGQGPFTYQWRLNGQNIPGATADTYIIESLRLQDAGQYTVAITDLAGAVTSDPAEITISDFQRLAPADNFANALALPTPSGTIRSRNLGATREPSEPNHADKPGQRSIWFAFTAPANGQLQLATTGSSFDTLLAIYSGATLAELTPLASNDDAEAAFATSAATANVQSGQRYFIAIDGFADASGEIIFAWQFTPDLPPAPRITAQPESLTAALGAEVTLAVTAENVTAYQWRRNGADLAGANSPSLVLPALQRSELGAYDVLLTGPGGSVASRRAEVQTGTVPGVLAVDKLFDHIIDLRAPAPAPARAFAADRPTPRASVSAPSVHGFVGIPGSHEDSTIGATRDPNEPNHAGEAGGASTWFVIIADAPGILEVTTAGSDFDTVLAIYTGPELVLSYAQLTPVASNNDAAPNLTTSRVTVTAAAGQYFYCAIDGVRGATGRARFNYNLGIPPTIAENPTSQTILARAPVTLRVRANNAADATYQWFLNGAPIPDATAADLLIPDAQPHHAGQYTALIETFAGRAISQPATLAITPAQPLQFTAQPTLNGAQLRLQIRGGSALPIRLETSPNLIDWQDLPIQITDNHIDLPLPAEGFPAFYRLIQ